MSLENQADASKCRTLWFGKDFGSYPKGKWKPLRSLRQVTVAIHVTPGEGHQ